GGGALGAGQLEQRFEHLPRVLVVLHDDDAPRTRRRLARRAPGIVGAGGGTAGQPNGEAASPPFPRAPRLDAPAVQLDELAHEGEPDPQTPFRAIGRAVPLEEEIE